MTDTTNPTVNRKPSFNFLLHLHPRKVRRSTLDFTLTFGLGGMTLLLILFQVITGLFLKFHYSPNPAGAYDSIADLTTGILFGGMLRNLHHWSALFLIWISFLHMLRVFFTGAYTKPRHQTWIFGVVLLILIVLSNFTGYLLPWDQLSYWAITISTGLLDYIPFVGGWLRSTLLGGDEVGQATLSNFYNLHTGILPWIMALLMAHHFWHIRKAGGVVSPVDPDSDEMVDTRPHLIYREFIAALVLIGILFFVSSLIDAPLRERANPSYSPNPAKAPWYFMGLQELLIHIDPTFAIFVLPLIILIALFRLPYSPGEEITRGVWFLSERGKQSARRTIPVAITGTIVLIALSELLPSSGSYQSFIPSLILKGVLPVTLLAGLGYYFMRWIRKSYSLNKAETIQSIAILIILSYSILTITGIFFRGEGMKLMWPWNI